MRNVIMRLDTNMAESFEVETDLSHEQLKQLTEEIKFKLMNEDDGWNEEKVFESLEQSGAIKKLKKVEVLNIII